MTDTIEQLLAQIPIKDVTTLYNFHDAHSGKHIFACSIGPSTQPHLRCGGIGENYVEALMGALTKMKGTTNDNA